MNAIFKRRSIRKYKDDPVSDEQIKALLQAAMAAPTACNAQEWEFIVIKSRETRDKIVEIHPYAKAFTHAPVGILVCANLEKETIKGYWPQDAGAAIQNILLQATEMGLGSLWMGIYPDERIRKSFIELFTLPPHVVPVSIVAIGTAVDPKGMEDRYDPQKVFQEVYGK